MRKLFFMLLMCCAFIACDDEDKGEKSPDLPIKNLRFPTEEIFKAGEKITIQGEGFTSTDEIFLKSAKVKSVLSDKVPVTNIQVTETSITFTLPTHVTGKYEIILCQNDKEYVLGELTIEEREREYYAFCYDSDICELAKLDLKNEKLVWTGIKIPAYKGNGRGEAIEEVNNEFIAFEPYRLLFIKEDWRQRL